MATTKIFPITATVSQAIAYIAASAKTDNGRLISTYLCSRIPDKAAKEFAEVTATGTGRSKGGYGAKAGRGKSGAVRAD